MAAYFNQIVTATILAAVEAAGPRTLRILEVGAGTGGTTAALLPELPAARVSYQFTDVSDFFLARAQQKFAAYPFVRFSLLNLETDAAQQGYEPGSFEVVVAANVLHATRNLDQTLQGLRTLLAPGGLLVLYETTHHLSWYDITTGLIEGWQLFEDQWRGDNPLLAAPRWAEALRANGFDAVAAFPEAGTSTTILGQHVIIAQAPGGGVKLGVAGHTDLVSSAAAGGAGADVAATGNAAAVLVAELQAMPPSDQIDALVDFVRDQVRRVLRLDAAQPVDRRDRLMDIGFDSLMAVELRARLTSALGLAEKLPATLMFDYPTPEAIASYLARVLALANEASPAAPSTPLPSLPQAESETDLQGLTDEEVEAMLLKKLKDIQ
jgi:SAM-dependent methyltransferase/acyl carrier protein